MSFLLFPPLKDTCRQHAVEMTKALDFLKKIVKSVPDPSAGQTIDLEAGDTENSKCMRGKTTTKGTAPAAGEQKKRRRWGGRGGLSRDKVRVEGDRTTIVTVMRNRVFKIRMQTNESIRLTFRVNGSPNEKVYQS